MRYTDGYGTLKADELSDLKYGEYKCTQCNKIIKKREDVIPNDKGQYITTNSINFCSGICRKENRRAYDRSVSYI
jgi:hypothetical protein